jgi:hypothetical protein
MMPEIPAATCASIKAVKAASSRDPFRKGVTRAVWAPAKEMGDGIED